MKMRDTCGDENELFRASHFCFWSSAEAETHLINTGAAGGAVGFVSLVIAVGAVVAVQTERQANGAIAPERTSRAVA